MFDLFGRSVSQEVLDILERNAQPLWTYVYIGPKSKVEAKVPTEDHKVHKEVEMPKALWSDLYEEFHSSPWSDLIHRRDKYPRYIYPFVFPGSPKDDLEAENERLKEEIRREKDLKAKAAAADEVRAKENAERQQKLQKENADLKAELEALRKPTKEKK